MTDIVQSIRLNIFGAKVKKPCVGAMRDFLFSHSPLMRDILTADARAATETPTLTRAELTEMLCDCVGLNKHESKEMVEAFFEALRDALEGGESVKLAGFCNNDSGLTELMRSTGAGKQFAANSLVGKSFVSLGSRASVRRAVSFTNGR